MGFNDGSIRVGLFETAKLLRGIPFEFSTTYRPLSESIVNLKVHNEFLVSVTENAVFVSKLIELDNDDTRLTLTPCFFPSSKILGQRHWLQIACILH